MTWLRRKPKQTHMSLRVDGKTITFPVSEAGADAIMALYTEAQELRRQAIQGAEALTEMDRALAALEQAQEETRERHRVEAQAQQARIDGQADIIAGLNKALALARETARADVDHVLAEVHKLDAALVAAQVDLGREREDHRAFKARWARHLNSCAVADSIDQEDAAKARSR